MVITVLLFSGTRNVTINLSTREERTLVPVWCPIHLLGTTRLLPRLQHPISLHRLRSSILVQPLSFSPAIDEI